MQVDSLGTQVSPLPGLPLSDSARQRSATVVSSSLNRQQASLPLELSRITEIHEQILEDLSSGQILSGRKFSANGNLNKVYKLEIRSNDGQVVDALFKPRTWGDDQGWGRNSMEYVAYVLNRELGFDHVPPAVYRRNVSFKGPDGAVDNKEGSIHYFAQDAHLLFDRNHPRNDVPLAQWDLRWQGQYNSEEQELFRSDTRILDVLLQNPDRHGGNFIRGKHWVDGSYRPILIDHAACLRRGGSSINMTQGDVISHQPIRTYRGSTLAALRRLNFDRLKTIGKGLITDDEIKSILSRRDGVVAYLESVKA